MGVANPYGRTRMPLWVDLNRDGRLDLFEGAEARFDDRTPPFTFLRQGDRFVEAPDALKFASKIGACFASSPSSATTRISTWCAGRGQERGPRRCSIRPRCPRRSSICFRSRRSRTSPPATSTTTGPSTSFWRARILPGPVAFGRPGDNEIIADVSIDEANAGQAVRDSVSVRRARSASALASVYSADALAAERVHIGKQGAHPEGLSFSLSPDTPGVAGTAPYQPGAQTGVYVGLTAPDKWQVFVSGAPHRRIGRQEPDPSRSPSG